MEVAWQQRTGHRYVTVFKNLCYKQVRVVETVMPKTLNADRNF